jgi:pilus assembly protein FimV
MKRKLLSIALAATLFKASYVSALGLGEIELESYLNEPLDARIEILNTEGLLPTQILVRLASENDFDRVGIERSFFLTGINFQVVIDSEGDSYVAVSTRDPVREPFLDFVIETRWPSGRLLREYTVLLDPPSFDDGIVISASDVVAAEGERRSDTFASQSRSARSAPRSDADTVTDRPEPGQSYRVKPNETLWEIALEAKLPGTSVQATMLEIQRQNPDAFINNNINLLKAGRVVYLPTELDASLSDSEVVLANIRRQNQDWRAGRVSAPAARLRIAGDQFDSERDDAVAVADKATVDTTSRSGVQVDNAKLAELQSQLSVLQEQLEVMQAIIETKDKQIALLQNALSGNESTQSSGDTSERDLAQEPQKTALVDGSTVDTTSESRAAADLAGTDTASSDNAQATIVDLAAPVVAAKPAPAVQTTAKDDGLSISLIAGGVGAAAVLAALGLMWQRRRSSVLAKGGDSALNSDLDVDDDVFSKVSLNDSGLEIDHDSSDDPLPAHITESFSGNAKTDQYASDMDIDDALAEADIYIAYGRINQAVELLQGSLEKNPGADECRLKLLEVLVDAGRESEAKAAYAGVLDQCSRDVVVRADELMMRGGFLLSQQKSAGSSATVEEVFDLGADSSLFGPYGDALDSILGDSRDSAPQSASDESMPDESGADADLDAVEPETEEVGIPPELEELQEELEVADDAALGDALAVTGDSEGPDEVDSFFDQLQAQQQERERAQKESDMRAREAALAAQAEADALNDPFADLAPDESSTLKATTEELLEDFDLSHLVEEDDSTQQPSLEPEPLEFDLSDLDLERGPADLSDEIDLSDFEVSYEDQESAVAEESSLDLDDALDLSSFEDFDLEPAPAPRTPEDDIFVADGEDAPAAKLDLARAYIDMEDFDSARGILEDVARTGDDAQRREAEALLTTLL